MLKIDGEWKETDWQNALDNVSTKLLAVKKEFGADSIGLIASPTATLEEFFLLKKLMDGLGSGNMDYRLRQQDFRGDGSMSAPLLGASIAKLDSVDAVLLLGSNLRKEQPILAARLRKAIRRGAKVSAINTARFDFAMPMQNNIAVSPTAYVATLARLALVAAEKAGKTVDSHTRKLAADCAPDKKLDAIADHLINAGSAQVIVGSMAQMDTNYALVELLARKIAGTTGALAGRLEEGNAVAAWQVGMMPAGNGKNAIEMLTEPLRTSILFNIEPGQDSILGGQAIDTLKESGMVIYIGNYRSDEIEELADIMLPLAVNLESDGSHVNCEAKIQSWQAAVQPAGDSRPGWKILRVIGNYLDLDGFEYTTAEAIRGDVGELAAGHKDATVYEPAETGRGLPRISYVPIYRTDVTTRRSLPLQQTQDNPAPTAVIHPETLNGIGAADGDMVVIRGGDRSIEISVRSSDSVPAGCVMLPTATPETAALANANWLEVEGNA
jgi:NADH-quinone oxidoreductase subunit G